MRPQEADIQRHRKRLISAGEIEVIAGGNFGPRRQQSFQESTATFEGRAALTPVWQSQRCAPSVHAVHAAAWFMPVLHTATGRGSMQPVRMHPPQWLCNAAPQVLAEVLQQQARLDDPGAAARQEYERCAGRTPCGAPLLPAIGVASDWSRLMVLLDWVQCSLHGLIHAGLIACNGRHMPDQSFL